VNAFWVFLAWIGAIWAGYGLWLLIRITNELVTLRIRIVAHLDWLENGGNPPGEVIPLRKPPGNSDD
jgi:hypothetical protein